MPLPMPHWYNPKFYHHEVDIVCQTCDMIRGLLMARNVPEPLADLAVQPVAQLEQQVVKKAKRKVSKYQREFGKQMKRLKKKHPRTQAKNLMKKAHNATKRIMKR